MSNIQIDDRQVLAMFSEFNARNRKQVFRSALRQSAGILVRQSRKNLRAIETSGGKLRANTPNRWNGRKMEQGIKTSMARDAKSIKVHLLGDFRLKFFEMGTKGRHTKGHRITGKFWSRGEGRGRIYLHRVGKGGYRGRIEANRFFAQSKQETEGRIFREMDQRISYQVKRINDKYR